MFARLTDARSRLKAGCLAVLPGLVHFSEKPIRLAPDEGRVAWMRIFLPETEILNLKQLRIEGPSPDAMAQAVVSISSIHRSMASAEGFLQGLPLHTEREPFPFWQLRFRTPATVKLIELWNRQDAYCGRAYGLCVALGLHDGRILSFDSLDPEVLRLRLGEFQARLADLVNHVSALRGAARPPDPAIRELQSAAAALLARAAALLAGVEAPVAEGEAARLRLIAALTALGGEHLEGRHLVAFLALAAKVMDALINRSLRPAEEVPSPTETEGLALLFGAMVVATGKVTLGGVTECDALLKQADRTRQIEARVNRLYERAGKDPVIQPIMFRAHGMSGSELRRNAERFVAAMKEVEAELGAIGHPAAICYGTLLGAVRTGEFIPHDDDVDMIMQVQATSDDALLPELAQIVARLKERGVQAGITEGFRFLKVVAPKAGRHVDVFPIVRSAPGTVRMYMQQLRLRDVPEDCVLPYSSMEFYGERFAIPADPPRFLEERYGATWRTPMRIVGSTNQEA